MFDLLFFGLWDVFVGAVLFYQYNTYRYLRKIGKLTALTAGLIAVGIGCLSLYEFGRVITG